METTILPWSVTCNSCTKHCTFIATELKSVDELHEYVHKQHAKICVNNHATDDQSGLTAIAIVACMFHSIKDGNFFEFDDSSSLCAYCFGIKDLPLLDASQKLNHFMLKLSDIECIRKSTNPDLAFNTFIETDLPTNVDKIISDYFVNNIGDKKWIDVSSIENVNLLFSIAADILYKKLEKLDIYMDVLIEYKKAKPIILDFLKKDHKESMLPWYLYLKKITSTTPTHGFIVDMFENTDVKVFYNSDSKLFTFWS